MSPVVLKVPVPRGEGPPKARNIHYGADRLRLPGHVAKIGPLDWAPERTPFPGVSAPAPRTSKQRRPIRAGDILAAAPELPKLKYGPRETEVPRAS